MDIQIKRIAYNDSGTWGVLILDPKGSRRPIAVTLELPWHDNKQNISCIPEDHYICRRVNTPKHGECFEVANVEDRTDILIHTGNTLKDSQGCILIGECFEPLNNQDAIIYSKQGYGEFWEAERDVECFNLEIVRA